MLGGPVGQRASLGSEWKTGTLTVTERSVAFGNRTVAVPASCPRRGEGAVSPRGQAPRIHRAASGARGPQRTASYQSVFIWLDHSDFLTARKTLFQVAFLVPS